MTRLINIGVEPYLISSAVNAILAQRLVRKICQHCKEQWDPSDEMKEFLTLQGFAESSFYKGKGCDRCRKTGYSGRLGIYELMLMDDAMRDIVTAQPGRQPAPQARPRARPGDPPRGRLAESP